MTQARQAQSSVVSASPRSAEQENIQSKPTVIQSLITGSVAGATEVLIDHPLWSIKTRMQRGHPFTLNPAVLYRGIVPNAASMMPITALQVGFNQGFQNRVYKGKKDLSNSQRLGSAFIAGVGSSFVSCPTEMIITYQGVAGENFYAATKNLIRQAGMSCLWTALPATAMREGMFTAFYLAVTPILKTKLKPYCSNDDALSLAAGMGAGVGATLASQGVDTLKTVQQTAKPAQPLGFKDAVSKIYSTQGVQGFFKGLVPRGARVMSAVTIMGVVNEKMETVFRKGGGPAC